MTIWPIDWHWLWLAVAAFLAGVLNAVAGGGSFLLFPALLGMRMLPVQANATNTVALWPGQMTSVWAYWEEIKLNRRLAPTLGLAGLLGGTAGAVVLLNTPQKTFMHLVPWLLLVAASIFAVSGPVSRWLARRRLVEAGAGEAEGEVEEGGPRLLPVFVAAMLVCFYIGYFRGRRRVPDHHGAVALRLQGSERDQRVEGSCDDDGQRHGFLNFCFQRPGGLEVLPAGDVDLRGGWIRERAICPVGAAGGAARICDRDRIWDGGVVLF